MTQALLAFAAGVLTVAAPCVLPLLPVVLGASAAGGPGSRPLFIAAGFALSFTGLALVFGAFQEVLGLSQEIVRDAAALLLVLFGLLMVWPRPFQRMAAAGSAWLNRVAGWGQHAGPGWAGGLLLGASLGAIWTPCAGPVLASILALVASQASLAAAGTLLACYALGAALPMLAIAYGGQAVVARVRVVARHAHRLQQAFGCVVVAVGAATWLQVDTVATVWLARFYPSQALFGL